LISNVAEELRVGDAGLGYPCFPIQLLSIASKGERQWAECLCFWTASCPISLEVSIELMERLFELGGAVFRSAGLDVTVTESNLGVARSGTVYETQRRHTLSSLALLMCFGWVLNPVICETMYSILQVAATVQVQDSESRPQNAEKEKPRAFTTSLCVWICLLVHERQCY
jgi:hypothetical protein